MSHRAKTIHNIFGWLGLIFLISGLTVVDQVTKYIAEKHYLLSSSPLEIHDYRSLSQPVFHIGDSNWLNFSLTYTRNTGAAWGFLGNLPENIRPYFFYILTFVAMCLIVYFFFKIQVEHRTARIGIVLIFAGALGNYIDRVWLHYVIDWIHFQWSVFSWKYDYPVFNVADCCVVSGVFLLLIDSLILDALRRRIKRRSKRHHTESLRSL